MASQITAVHIEIPTTERLSEYLKPENSVEAIGTESFCRQTSTDCDPSPVSGSRCFYHFLSPFMMNLTRDSTDLTVNTFSSNSIL